MYFQWMWGVQLMDSSALALDGNQNSEATRFASWRTGNLLHRGNWLWSWRCQPAGLMGIPRFDYVLKTLQPGLSLVERGRAAARLSNRMLAYESIDHAGLIPVVDAELDRQPFYVVEPWIGGETADRWAQSWPEVCVSRMMWVVRQVAEIVSAAHEQSRAHLNLCPENILIDHEGKVKVTGWSLSTIAGLSCQLQGLIVERNRFSAPESCESNYRVDLSADIYALGMVIFFLCSGRFPSAGQELRTSQPEAPFRLSRLLQKMIAAQPRQRPDAKQVVDELISVELDHLHNDHPIIWGPPDHLSDLK